jgi:hypothetical protein
MVMDGGTQVMDGAMQVTGVEVIGAEATGVAAIIRYTQFIPEEAVMLITSMDREDLQEQTLTGTTEVQTQIMRFPLQAGIKVQFQGKITIPAEILFPILEDVKHLKTQG